MFTGWSLHTMDEKGRLAIPARFRGLLKSMGATSVVVTTLDKCLVCYPPSQWQALADKISRLPPLDPRVRAFKHAFISGASECEFDRQGRILLPLSLREEAGLRDQVMVVGMQQSFELWDKARWEEHRAQILANFDELSAMISEMGV